MAEADDTKAKKERSPSFPFISLRKAVERTEALLANHRNEAARLIAVAPTWNYGAKSSGFLQTIGALKQYGLIDDLGSGEDRKIQITDLGKRIVRDQRPGAREEAIREAALSPKLLAEYAQKWVPDRPSDAHCISELELDRGFSAEAARSFLKVFDETASYAGLSGEDELQEPSDHASSAAEVASDVTPASGAQAAKLFLDWAGKIVPPGLKPLNERLQVSTDGFRLSVTAALINQEEVNTLIRILEANKLVLPTDSKAGVPSSED